MSLTADEKLAIHELLSRAAYAYDEKDLEMLAGCFTEDVAFTIQISDADLMGPFKGRDAVMTLYADSMAAQTDVRRHVTTNHFFESQEDEPRIISNLTLFATENGETRLLSAGVYRDTVRRSQDGWLLCKRHLDLDSPY